MNYVADHRRNLSAEPALRERVLTVVHVALFLIVAGVVVEVVVSRARVHIPHLAVVATVGLLISRDESFVGRNVWVADNL